MITTNVNGNAISQDFIDQIRSDSPKVLARLMLEGSELSCDITSLQVFKGSCGSTTLTIGNVVGDRLETTLKNLTNDVKGKDLECHIGAWTGADYEWISLGVFTVSEAKKTRYETNITAYSGIVGKTSVQYTGNNSAPSIAELGTNVATQLGCTITFDPAIDTAQIVQADVLTSTLYQCLQAIAICSGGYVVNDNAGNILVKKYDSTATLSVDTGMMVKLPEVDETPVEVRSVKCNGEYPYSAKVAFLVDEQDRNIADQSDNLIYGYDTEENADVVFNCDYMTNEVFNANIVDIIGYTYWHADVGLTLGDPRLEGTDVLAVEDVDGTIYNVPCHEITHRYTGGIASDIKSAQPTEQQVDIGSMSPIGAMQELAYQTANKVRTNGQYFWFISDGAEAGVHVTSVPKDDFESSPDGGNMLARSDGLIMRDGLTEKAKFGVGEITVGETDSTHIEITSTGMKLYGDDGVNAGATIESGKIVLGGDSNEGGSIVVYDDNNAQVGKIDNDGVVALTGQIADITINSNGLAYSNSSAIFELTKSHLEYGRYSNYEYDAVELSAGGIINFFGGYSGFDSMSEWASIWADPDNLILNNSNGEEYDQVQIGQTDTTITTNVLIQGNFRVASGYTKSKKVDTKNYGSRLLYCYETPTPYFGDIGEATLDENGICYVDIDDIFSETATTKMEYQVFLQKEGQGDCYVAEKHERYFVIQGTPNLKVAWELKAKQKDFEYLRLEEDRDYKEYSNPKDITDNYVEEQERLLYG